MFLQKLKLDSKLRIATVVILIVLLGGYAFLLLTGSSSVSELTRPLTNLILKTGIEGIPQTVVLNKGIETEPRAFPAFVQSGRVEIGNPNDTSTYQLAAYRFGRRQPGERGIWSDTGKAYGIYLFENQGLKKVSSINQLRSEDFIYITFYETPAWSDSGRNGKTVLGLVNAIKRSGNEIQVKFANDPGNQWYVFSRQTPLQTQDQEGLFEFGGDVFGNISLGSTLRLLITDEEKVFAATVLAPGLNVAFGPIKSLRLSEAAGVEITLEGFPKPFLVSEKTKVVKRGEPNTPRSPEELQVGMPVNFVYYNHLNEYQVLSLDFTEI